MDQYPNKKTRIKKDNPKVWKKLIRKTVFWTLLYKIIPIFVKIAVKSNLGRMVPK